MIEASCEHTMLLTVSLFVLVSSTAAELTTRCGSDKDIDTKFIKTEGDIEGRYTVEWCSNVTVDATVWKLTLEYAVNNNSRPCSKENVSDFVRHKMSIGMKVHSTVELDITNRPWCNITCLSTPLDLVFSSCYKIVNQLINPNRTWGQEYIFHRVDNRFYSIEAFSKLRPIHTIEKDTHDLVVTYNLHYIPVDKFDMKAKEFQVNASKKEINNIDWVETGGNCTHETYTVVCRLSYPPSDRCVALALEYDAPWRNTINDPNVMYYCSPLSKRVELDPGMDARVWWAAGALALTLTVLATCWAAHARVLANVRKKVLHQWMNRYAEYTAEHTPAPVADPGHILLLYARDCEPAMEAIGVLKEMLEEGAPGRVYDIFSPECMTLYVDAPEEWLCNMLGRPDVRVVLVQTPAAAALYEAQVGQDSLQMQQPLLGARVQYKKPHYGDVLLQFALRLVRGMAPLQQEYARYYIATLSELDTELMPQVAPYRRYVLPAHAPRLLHDLRLRAELPPRLARLDAAVRNMLDYVRANENYLRDELMFL